MDDAKLDETIELLSTQLILRPNDAQKRFLLGNALRKQRRYDEAIAAYKRAIKNRPDFAEAHYQLGVALRENGDLEGALGAFDGAVGVKIDYVEAHKQRAEVCALLNRDDEAMESYEYVAGFDPNDRDAPREELEAAIMSSTTLVLILAGGLVVAAGLTAVIGFVRILTPRYDDDPGAEAEANLPPTAVRPARWPSGAGGEA